MVTGIVLAGGKSFRMGFDKCLLKYNNLTFVEIALNLISNISDNILLSSNNDEFSKYGCKIVKDKFENIGPIGGIYSTLSKSKTEQNIFIPCDLPYLSVDLLDLLLEKSEHFDAVVPVFKQKVEPLVGVYKKKMLSIIEENINNKKYKILSLLERVNTLFLPITDKYDFYSEKLFKNVNTLDDYNSLV